MTRREIAIGRKIHEKLCADERECTAFSELGRLDSRAAGQALAIMNGDVCATVYSSTEARYFSSGESMHSSMLEDIASAKDYVFLEYFIIKNGVMWCSIRDLLIEKSRAGVEVRVLFDDIGCMSTVTREMISELTAEGIKCASFAKVNPSLSTVHNNRDHRKILVIDGSIAYTGGINIADEYINAEERFGHWKDGGVRLFGKAARGFVKLYLQIWNFNAGICEDFSPYLDRDPVCAKGEGYFLPFGSGPAPIYPRSVGKETFLNVINQAERYVYITTPYLVIDFDLTVALRGAALRGVDVRIITPAIADKRIVKIMTKSAYPYLMEAGVRIYEYTPGFIHEKLVVSDDIYTVIGSINFDYRSLAHHFECAAWMYSSELATTARDDFMSTVAVSEPMNDKGSRLKLSEWIVKNLVRFIAPLL